MKKNELAQDILEGVGGKSNVKDVFHCATRLRFHLKDTTKANTSDLKKLSGVIQIVQSGGQYQIVIGNTVGTVYEDLLEVMGEVPSKGGDGKSEQGLGARMISLVSAIFTPFLGVLAGTGVLKGILSLGVFLMPEFQSTGTYVILNAAGDAFFRFLPIAIAFTAAKKLNTNQYLAMAMAMAMVYPIENSDALNFLGIPVIYGAGYTSTVFPIIMAVFILKYIEGFFKKIMPSFLIFGVSLCSLIIMVPLTYTLIGPLGTIIGSLLSNGVTGLYSFSPLLTGLIMGGLWQVLVIFGMHWGIVPIILLNLGTNGFDSFLPMAIAGVMAQSGASLGVFLRTRDARLKGLSLSSALTAVFGITEPAVYGVTLPLKKPFIYASIGGAIGGAYIALMGVKTFAFSTSILVLPNMIGRNGITSSAVQGMIGLGVAFVVAMILTVVIGFDDKKEIKDFQELDEKSNTKQVKKVEDTEGIISSPISGEIIPLTAIDDPAFSSGAMGKGVAILPNDNLVIAPVSGKVTLLFPTNHAIGILTDDGIEILIHIGMDTVELKGEGFVPFVKQGEYIHKGQKLIQFDPDVISKHEKSAVTVVVITNSNKYSGVEATKTNEIKQGMDLLEITK